MTYATGGKYVGAFKDDPIHRQGTLIFGKGEWERDQYVGEWKDSKMHGQGTFTWANGAI